MEAAKAAAGDFFLGWYGRQLALREILFRKDPKVERIKKSIDEMKAQQPETVDSKTGEITRQRNPVPHPDGKGTMQSRVTGVVHHPDAKGTIMLVMDKSESAYGLPGGQIAKRYYPGALGFTKGADGRMYLTFEGAMHGQIKSETGVGIKNTQYVDVYRGKVNEHALSGSRVYEATADGVKLDPVEATRRHGKKGELPELKDALWWDGKTDITVYPATRDILLAFAKEYGWDMSKVHVYKGASSFLKRSRDRQFFYRRRLGEQLTEKQIEAVNAREIKSLNGEWNQHLKGEPASLRHFLEGEYDLTDILQLIEGRRRVLKTFEQTGRLDLMQEAAIKRSGLWEKYENALKAEEKVRAEEVSRIYDEAMTKVLEGEMYQPYMDALTMARIDNYPAYVSRYLHYYREAMRNPAKPVEAIRREYETAYKDVLQNYNKVQQYVSEQRPTPKRYDAPRKGGSSGYTTGKYPPTTQYPPPTTPPPGEPPPPQEPPVYPPYDLKVPPPPDTPKRPPRKSPALLTKKDRQRYAVGDVGWKQGRFWIKARPPWGDKPRKVATSGDVVYSLRALPGAKVLKGTPEETFFTRGKRLPKRFVVSMGSSKVTVRPKDKPHLLFGPGSKYAKKKRKNRKKARR